MSETLLELVVGVAAGFASGIAGIGGGVVMVPAMVFFLGLTQATAQGTSLLAIIFTSVAATAVNVRNGRTQLGLALLMGAGGVFAAQVGKDLALALPGETLQRFFGVFVLVNGARIVYREWSAARALKRA